MDLADGYSMDFWGWMMDVQVMFCLGEIDNHMTAASTATLGRGAVIEQSHFATNNPTKWWPVRQRTQGADRSFLCSLVVDTWG
jgi:hypothetical protein